MTADRAAPTSAAVATGAGFRVTAPGTDRPLQLRDGAFRDTGARHPCVDGVWDFVDATRREAVDTFAGDYAAVRAAEARTPPSPEAVRALPYADLTGELEEMWAERAASFDRFLAALDPTDGTVVDLGAGCGWLAARLAGAGWTAAAVDVTVDGGDGLGTARWHDRDLFLVRAEMDRLPLATGSVDLAVFNASLHYAPDVSSALDEAQRVVRPGGLIAVLDSPVFTDPAAGAAMVAEFAAATVAAHGVAPAAHFGPGYVAEADLQRFVRTHRPAAVTRVDDRRGPVGALRSLVGARRAGREIAKRPLLLFETRANHRHGKDHQWEDGR
ncbi:MAG: class I SAM-dependent methyltransferase [Actinomycetota bacterium]